MWNAWGIAWGDSWGSSWGPLYEVEENPGQVYGSGKQLRGPADDALIAQVLDKWETIEAAQAVDAARKQAKTVPAAGTAAPVDPEPPQAGPISQLLATVATEQAAQADQAAKVLQAQIAIRRRISNEQAMAAALLALV